MFTITRKQYLFAVKVRISKNLNEIGSICVKCEQLYITVN